MALFRSEKRAEENEWWPPLQSLTLFSHKAVAFSRHRLSALFVGTIHQARVLLSELLSEGAPSYLDATGRGGGGGLSKLEKATVGKRKPAVGQRTSTTEKQIRLALRLASQRRSLSSAQT